MAAAEAAELEKEIAALKEALNSQEAEKDVAMQRLKEDSRPLHSEAIQVAEAVARAEDREKQLAALKALAVHQVVDLASTALRWLLAGGNLSRNHQLPVLRPLQRVLGIWSAPVSVPW